MWVSVRHHCSRLLSAALIVVVCALTLPLAPLLGAADEAVSSAGTLTNASDADGLLQFNSAGHVVGFGADGVTVASTDHMLKVEFLNAAPVSPTADQTASGGGTSLNRVTYADLWDGVTAVYETGGGSALKSTWHLSPADDGVPVDRILLGYNRPVSIDDGGNLVVAFQNGNLVESAPVAWQEIDGARTPVAAAYIVYGDREVGFSLGEYVPGVPVVIDPMLTWNTFVGGSDVDFGLGVAVDDSGNVYVCGYSYATWGAPKRSFTGVWDAYAAKLDASGNLLWNTFLGGTGADQGFGIAVDDSGNVYVCGSSPSSWGSPRRDYTAGADAFAAKLDSYGYLVWNTFLGGSGDDSGRGIAVDGGGNVYMAGDSTEGWGSPERAYSSGIDAFAAKLDDAGDLTWNTFLGGSGSDAGHGIATDGNGNSYVCGASSATWGTDPLRTHGGGPQDGLIAKLDDGGEIVWYTFLGGSGNDVATGIAADASEIVYASGVSDATWGDPVRGFGGGAFDAFAATLQSDGDLTFNTFLGGSGADYGYGVAADSDGNIYVSGRSTVTWGSPVREYTVSSEAFAAKISCTGEVAWNTFLGGSQLDYGQAIAVDGSGNIYVAGYSYATWGSPARAYSSSADAFVVKLGGIPIELKAGWNMVSLPVEIDPASRTPDAVFPGNVAVYTWNPTTKSYTMPLQIELGCGYWVAVTSDRTIVFTGG